MYNSTFPRSNGGALLRSNLSNRNTVSKSPSRMNASQPIRSSKTSSDKIYKEYTSKRTIYEKQAVIDKALSVTRVPLEVFEEIIKCLLDEPEECFYRIDIFDYFFYALKVKDTTMLKSFVTKISMIEEFILKTPYLEYIDIFLSYVFSFDKVYLNRIKELLLKKVESMPVEIQFIRLYIEDIEKYISFKQTKPEYRYTGLSDEKLYFIRKAVKRIFNSILMIADRMDADLLCNVLIRWLLILDPQQDIRLYELVYSMSDLLKNAALTSSSKAGRTYDIYRLKSNVVGLFSILQIKSTQENTLNGFNNLVIALELIPEDDLCYCLNKFFVEIVQVIGDKKESLENLFYNLLMTNFTSNSCLIIQTLSENFKVNMLYDQLFYIFNTIIIPYSVAKLKVIRAFKENFSLCKFYFYGFAALPLALPQSLQEDFIEIIKFHSSIKKDPTKKILVDILEFIEIVCYLYTRNSQQENNWFEMVRQYVQESRKEFSIKTKDIGILADSILKENVWRITKEDLENQMMLIATDIIGPSFKPTTKYKGIKNIGNTCYIASTMQALYCTMDFRKKILELANETMKTSTSSSKSKDSKSTKSSETPIDILRETQILLNDLEVRRPEPRYVDPRNFRETLPKYFRLANKEQDTSEFRRVYFDLLEDRLKRISKQNLIDECFAGSIETTLKCSKCEKVKTKTEKFLELVLNFPPEKEEGSIDELEMLKQFFEPEKLTDILCETCKTRSSETIKKTYLVGLPQYLIITLNRFKFEKVGIKLSTNVVIHHELDFADIVPDSKPSSVIYSLYAVIVHIGESAEHGHYYVLVKDKECENGWFFLNDAQCMYAEDIKLAELFRSNPLETPYVLFYEAKPIRSKEKKTNNDKEVKSK